ncbi:MAG: hypothetical protein ACXACE_00735 [Candidatus Thorarchaeota archaeon]
MVSRSLEKMMLIAIGLTTVVIVGVPVLLYAMDTLSGASQLDMAETFATRIHDVTLAVDNGTSNDTLIEVNVPSGVTVSAVGNSLSVTLQRASSDPIVWSWDFNHNLQVVQPESSGLHILQVRYVAGIIELTFTLV